MENIKLPYGVRDGNLVHISEVQSGLSCSCLCPACEVPLIARKGKKVSHHFAHHKSPECSKAIETALHMAAKQILESHRKITLPPVYLHFNAGHPPIAISKSKTYRLEKVYLERRMDQIVPDIYAEVGDRRLLIEVRVASKVDQAKLARIKSLGISAIEIDLSNCDRVFEIEVLTHTVVSQLHCKSWLYNSRVNDLHQQLLGTGIKKERITQKGAACVKDCPIGRRERGGVSYAYLMHDCKPCLYSLGFDYDDGDAYQLRSVICGGYHKISSLEDLMSLSAMNFIL